MGKRAGGRRKVVRDGRGRAGGIHKQRPSPHNACKSVKRARTFCAMRKSLAACADLLPLARLFWAKSMFTPLPAPGLPSRSACPSPLPRRSSFVIFPPARGGWEAQRCTTLWAQKHNQRPTTLAHQRGWHLAGNHTPAPCKIPRLFRQNDPLVKEVHFLFGAKIVEKAEGRTAI